MFITDPESRIRMFPIPDPKYWIQIFSILNSGSHILIFSILGPGARMHIKELKYFNQKNGFSALRNMIQVFHPGSGSRIWILTFYLSQIPILDPRSQIQGSKRQRIPDPRSRIRIRNTGDFGFAQAVGRRGKRQLLTFNGHCCLKDSFNGSALRSFYVQKRILRIFYKHIISLIFTVFKLWCPAHLFPNTPRMWYSCCCCNSCSYWSGHWPSCLARISPAYLVQLLLLQLRLLFRALTQLFSKDFTRLPRTAVAATAAASVPGTDPAV